MIYTIKEEMKKISFCGKENLDVPEDVINEIVILYSLGVNMQDLKYLLAMRLDES